MVIRSLMTIVTYGDQEVTSFYDASIIDGEYDILDMLKKQLNSIKNATDWTVYDGRERIAAKSVVATVAREESTELLKQACRELYAEHGNYAKVAKLIGKHPTTVRSWLTEES